MPEQITLARVWCNEHLAQCWHINENGMTRPLCSKESIQPAGSATLGAKIAELKEKGFTISHHYPQYVATRYKSQPLALPLDWQMAIEERQTKEPEYIQDW
jgi:NOL1/NOP2/fmu family ribosome biogenesis protein